MKRISAIIMLLLVFLLSSCGQKEELQYEETTQSTSETVQATKSVEYSFEGVTFHYGEKSFDVTSNVEAINNIMSAIPVGDKIILNCHAGPKNGVYCIFDTVTNSFDEDIIGNNLIWFNDHITTAVYSYWSDVYSYDGTLIKSYDLSKSDYIYELAFSDNYSKLKVTILYGDDTKQVDIIEL